MITRTNRQQRRRRFSDSKSGNLAAPVNLAAAPAATVVTSVLGPCGRFILPLEPSVAAAFHSAAQLLGEDPSELIAGAVHECILATVAAGVREGGARVKGLNDSMAITWEDRSLKGERIMVSLPASLVKFVEQEAADSRRTKSEVVRRAVLAVYHAGGLREPEPPAPAAAARRPTAETLLKCGIADVMLRATPEERLQSRASHTLFLRPCVWRIIDDEAQALGITRSAVVEWLVAFCQQHQEEARTLALPWS